jgi:transcriptional regulator with XRE-family HTH domain
MKRQSSKNHKSIRDYLKRTGQTEVELAELARISQSSVNKIKNGTRRPTPEVAARLETITGIPLRILLFKVEKKADNKARTSNSPSSKGKRLNGQEELQRTDFMEKTS